MPNATPDPETWIGPDTYHGQQVWQHRDGGIDGNKYVVLWDNGEESLFPELHDAYRAVEEYVKES